MLKHYFPFLHIMIMNNPRGNCLLRERGFINYAFRILLAQERSLREKKISARFIRASGLGDWARESHRALRVHKQTWRIVGECVKNILFH